MMEDLLSNIEFAEPIEFEEIEFEPMGFELEEIEFEPMEFELEEIEFVPLELELEEIEFEPLEVEELPTATTYKPVKRLAR